MVIKKMAIFLVCSVIVIITTAQQAIYPNPYGALPSESQLRWHEVEQYVLIHFTPTTFENKEWGYGDADPHIFNPSSFDAAQIINAAKSGGFKGVILVAKHHDGFCLWPTTATPYNISKSPFRDGKGDMVKEFQLATREAGLQFGIYCSPWDRNNPQYGTKEYIKIFRQQLTELYTNYGDLFITWFDGANGGDGYYGGAKEQREINRSSYYDWDSTWKIVRKLQPNAAIFSDLGDVRWVGNEKGFASETSWATFTPKPLDGKTVAAPGEIKYWKAQEGTRNGAFWKPAECDVPLRPGWFYHPDQDNKVKSARELFDLYCKSVGRGAALDLGLSPNTKGLLHENDVKVLQEYGKLLKLTFALNLAETATFKASNIRGSNISLFGTQNLTDENLYSYWATDDSVTTAAITLEWKKNVQFNLIRLRENIKLGQRIENVEVDALLNGDWKNIGRATSIGANRIIRLSQNVSTTKLRIRITQSPVCIALSDIGVFYSPVPESIPIKKK